jgi:DNA-binding MarR family transcriptional regulator
MGAAGPVGASPSGADPTERVTAAIATLFRLEGSRRIHRQQAEAAGVPLTQHAIRLLGRVVDAEGRPGQARMPATPGQLAAWLELDPYVVARLLRQLEDGGYVQRRRSPDDGRVTTVHATPSGAEAFERIRQVIWRQMRGVLGGWPHSEVERLAGLLDRLVVDVQRRPYERLGEPVSARRTTG